MGKKPEKITLIAGEDFVFTDDDEIGRAIAAARADERRKVWEEAARMAWEYGRNWGEDGVCADEWQEFAARLRARAEEKENG